MMIIRTCDYNMFFLFTDPAVINVFYNSDYTFSSRLYGNLDVDLTHVKLPRPLSSIIQQTSIYIHKNIPKLCYNCLMRINEVSINNNNNNNNNNNYYY